MRAIAPKRSSVAGSTPPNRRSQTSVVVMSMTPDSRPLSASFSMAAAAGAGGVEDHAVVGRTELVGDGVTQGVVTPNMVRPIAGLPSGGGAGLRRHAGYRLGGVVQDDTGQPVQPGHVGHRRHHDDVGDVDIGRDVAGGERRDHDLGQAERQGAHARR